MRSPALFAVVAAATLLACAPQVDLFGSGAGAAGGGGRPGTGGASTSGTATSGTGGTTTSSSSGPPPCTPGPNDDLDGDGFSGLEGDCNDCDPAMGPGLFDVPGNTSDDDCDGGLDNAASCDENLAVDADDPLAAAQAIGLCKMAEGPKSWGVVSAKWVMADGAPPPADPTQLQAFHLGHGILSGLGPNVPPKEGARVLALSSGVARQPTDPGYVANSSSKGYVGQSPQGFPKENFACNGTTSGPPSDPTAVEIALRVPGNANGFSYAFDFYTHDFPEFVCSVFNDFFIAVLTPPPAGYPDGNIAFDKSGNAVSLNGSTYEVCGCMSGPPCAAGPIFAPCSLGTNQLAGTGFESMPGMFDKGATGWQITTAPVTPGSDITLRFGLYDSGDPTIDSLALVDDFRWLVGPMVPVSTMALP